MYEEYYTDSEDVENERMKALGGIVDKAMPYKITIDQLFTKPTALFDDNAIKEAVVEVIMEYLTYFDFIETDKSLGSEM